MEQEQFSPEPLPEESKHFINRVTPLSKYLARALFVILPFLGGYVGYVYAPEKVVEVERVVVEEVKKDDESENTSKVSELLYPKGGIVKAKNEMLVDYTPINNIWITENYNLKEYWCGFGTFPGRTCYDLIQKDPVTNEEMVFMEGIGEGSALMEYLTVDSREEGVNLYFMRKKMNTEPGRFPLVRLSLAEKSFTTLDEYNNHTGDIFLPRELKIVRATSSGQAVEVYDIKSKKVSSVRPLSEDETAYVACNEMTGDYVSRLNDIGNGEVVASVYDRNTLDTSCGSSSVFKRYEFINVDI